jgi:hypothetical protein
MGARRPAAEVGNACHHRNRSRTAARCSRATLQHGVRRPGGLLRRGRSDAHPDRRSDRIPRAQRHAAQSGRMTRTRLSGKVGAGLDPCAAIQVSFDLAAGQNHEIVFRLGSASGATPTTPAAWCIAFRGSAAAREALEAVAALDAHARRGAGGNPRPVPQPARQRLAACTRPWPAAFGRAAATYQSGGAFGFRDQLQDVMALIHAEPHLVREHLLRCAARQFRRAMFSIGGIRHRVGACARAVRTITSGCRWRPAAMSWPPATPACWTSPSTSSRAARSNR